MKLNSILDTTTTGNTFKEMTDALQSVNTDHNAIGQVTRRCQARFNPKTLVRYYQHNHTVGLTSNYYEDNMYQIIINEIREPVYSFKLGFAFGPVRHCLNSMSNIVGHTAGKPDVKIPKNNLPVDFTLLFDLTGTEDSDSTAYRLEKVQFACVNESRNTTLEFQHETSGLYAPNLDKMSNYFMPPDKGTRKEYRDKIEQLTKKVTLLSFLKDDKKEIKFSTDVLSDLYYKYNYQSKEISEYATAVYEHVVASYDAQLVMKQVIQHASAKVPYQCREPIKSMIKHFTNYRNDVPVDYFSCDLYLR